MNIAKKLSFYKDYKTFVQSSSETKKRFDTSWDEKYPCLNDKTDSTPFDKHYVYHTAWAARKIAETRPKKHIDISSYLYFSTLVSAFVPVDFYDYRPADVKLNNFNSKHADLLSLPFMDQSVKSLSCMHTIEHVGLGRYGDPIDYDGDLKAINELKRVLDLGGNLFFVVPVGSPRILFNAHRIYSHKHILGYFKELKLIESYLIPDYGEPILNPDNRTYNSQNYACGCYWFKK